MGARRCVIGAAALLVLCGCGGVSAQLAAPEGGSALACVTTDAGRRAVVVWDAISNAGDEAAEVREVRLAGAENLAVEAFDVVLGGIDGLADQSQDELIAAVDETERLVPAGEEAAVRVVVGLPELRAGEATALELTYGDSNGGTGARTVESVFTMQVVPPGEECQAS